MEIVDGGWGVGGCELVVCEVILFLLFLPYFILVSVVCSFCLWGVVLLGYILPLGLCYLGIQDHIIQWLVDWIVNPCTVHQDIS